MRLAKFLIPLFILLLSKSVFAVYTEHIGGSAGGTIYVKGEYSGGPNNSPLHESYDLITPGSLNYLGYYYRFIFYDGTLHIDPTGKVGFTEKIFGSGNDSTGYAEPQYGTINVEGYLTGAEIRPWKNGCDMEVNVWGNGIIELSSIFRVGISMAESTKAIARLWIMDSSKQRIWTFMATAVLLTSREANYWCSTATGV